MIVTYKDDLVSGAVAVVRREEFGWWLETIRVPRRERRKGHGSRLLDYLCADADRCAATIRLAVQPEPGGLVFGELVRWYERRGFADITGGIWERHALRKEAGWARQRSGSTTVTTSRR